MILRKFEEKDILQVLEICREMREHHRRVLNGYFKPIDEAYELKSLQETLIDDNAFALVAEEGDTICGWLCAEFTSRPYLENERFCHVCELGVLPDFRRQGIAESLMKKLFEEAKNRGISEINLGVFNDNIGAYKFYQKLGFKPLEQKMKIKI